MTGDSAKRFLLIYASQTGQAKSIAEEIAERASEHDLRASLHCMEETEKKFWLEREHTAVLISSTTGEGEPPDNGQKLWRRLKKRTLASDSLKDLKYSILGLGDSNYSHFCNCPKTFDRRLQELGAGHFYPPAWADDAVGLEIVVEPWIDRLFVALQKHLGLMRALEGPSDLITCEPVQELLSTGNSNNSSSNLQNEQSLHSQQPIYYQGIDYCALSGVVDCPSDLFYSSKLVGTQLSIPPCPSSYLQLLYQGKHIENLSYQNEAALPSAGSPLHYVTLVNLRKLTSEGAVKTALKITLSLQNTSMKYKAGDSFGIACPNDSAEVNRLLYRLNALDVSDEKCCLSIRENTQKRLAKIPEYLNNPGTLRHWFTWSCDIRTPPKKAFIRALAECTKADGEKRRLLELCSKQGMDEYQQFVLEPHISLLDVLLTFPSCHPPVETILEHCARLQARPFSAASSGLKNPLEVDFVFNIVEFSADYGRQYQRKGVCTGWLSELGTVERNVEDMVEALTLTSQPKTVGLYLRKNHHFRLTENLSEPIIMVGPGTGVAPFIGFLQERQIQVTCSSSVAGDSWLFFGCRNHILDFLFREELEQFLSANVLTHLHVCFSRAALESDGRPRYVQDMMVIYGRQLSSVIVEHNAHIYVCGDAKGMAKDVTKAVVDILVANTDMTEADAIGYVTQMKLNKRYLEDVWT